MISVIVTGNKRNENKNRFERTCKTMIENSKNKNTRKKFTNEDISLICDMWKQGKTATQICREVKRFNERKPRTLYPILIKAGLYKKKSISDLRRYSVDDSYFDEIDTERKAYWLGFLIADGFLTNSGHSKESFGIALKSEDKYILDELKKDLNATYPIHEYENKIVFDGVNYGSVKYSKIVIKSKQIFKALQNLGLTVNKSYNACLPLDKVPKELWNHLIRGYFDGDGSFSSPGDKKYHTYDIKFTGTLEVVSSIRNILGKDNLKLYQRYPNKNNNNYSLVICGDKQCYNIGKWMYKNSTIYLERKYSRYLELFNKYNKKSVVPTEM